MTEYIKRSDIITFANLISPTDTDFANAYKCEEIVLQKRKEIANKLKELPFIEIDHE